ncbi:N-acetylmuramate alpha-1-phosphate uridylyltransferase MurU [Pseudoalteromonas sp. T1lg65]|uniref:N-acetylmuramate alpha-1-phosphate uridylyltransferase MurU n=1 Tax=Pseudoalteromonas sp. T1lg65 TaxID=2077101 RepID=UPI003F7A6FCF
MKAMILAAGRGQRMMPLTAELPKPMLQVAGKPLLQYHIERIKQAGIKDIVINLAWQGEAIKSYFGDGSDFGVDIEYSEEPAGGLETAGGIIQALPLLCEQHETFIVINGDIFTDYDLHALTLLELASSPENGCQAHIVLVENPLHHPHGDFALTQQTHNDKKYTFSGISKYHKSFFENCAAGFVKLGPLLKQGLDSKKISTELYLGQWNDIGTPERLDAINRQIGQANVG